MNLKTRLSLIIISSVIIAILFIPSGVINQTSAFHTPVDPHHHFIDLEIPETENYVEDTIGDVKIRTVFHFFGGDQVVDSFRIFDQMSGYASGQPIMFQLLGGVGPDKQLLYAITDGAKAKQHAGRSVSPAFFDFDVDIYLFTRGDTVAFRHMMYTGCDVKDYAVTTLHDGDETFSGKTKFTIADAFTFQCTGYNPHCPICIQTIEDLRDSGRQISSLDLPKSIQTWEDLYTKLGIQK